MKPHKKFEILIAGAIVSYLLGTGYAIGAASALNDNRYINEDYTQFLEDKNEMQERAEKEDWDIRLAWIWDYILVGYEFGYNHPRLGKWLGVLYTFAGTNFVGMAILRWLYLLRTPPELR